MVVVFLRGDPENTLRQQGRVPAGAPTERQRKPTAKRGCKSQNTNAVEMWLKNNAKNINSFEKNQSPTTAIQLSKSCFVLPIVTMSTNMDVTSAMDNKGDGEELTSTMLKMVSLSWNRMGSKIVPCSKQLKLGCVGMHFWHLFGAGAKQLKWRWGKRRE